MSRKFTKIENTIKPPANELTRQIDDIFDNLGKKQIKKIIIKNRENYGKEFE